MGADAKPPATARMVRDNPALNRYELKLGDATAFATYVREPGRITLVHTEVPKELGGHGVGTALATGALADIRGRGEKVTAPEQLMPALRRAFDAIRSGTPALLNVETQNRNPG